MSKEVDFDYGNIDPNITFDEVKKIISDMDIKNDELTKQKNKKIVSVDNWYYNKLHKINNDRQTFEDLLVKLCGEHQFEYEGHDSHHNYYKCKKCGLTSKD